MSSKKTSHKGSVAAGLVGLTAAAVGAYFFYGHKDAVKNRAKAKSWMIKAKGEVLEELEKMENVTESGYHSAVGVVLKKYNDLKHVDREDVTAFLDTMKNEWKSMAKSIKKQVSKKKKK